ncbi:MAG: hypothetical protein JWO45_937 [Spartobacteria bacterium]|nr:hypothetical protein [Spartobacteria bacterium]
MDVSVIISTRNRARSLEKTLSAFAKVSVPNEWNAEVVIVDNASSDDTRGVVQRADLANFNVRYVFEGNKGKSIAQNAGIAASTADIILVTDDDVWPAPDWLELMALPLSRNECDAVVGRIELDSNLSRPWMKPIHYFSLAATETTYRGQPELIGCNMGFKRSVLTHVPAFDPELGPGALGFGEETLFSWQLCEAGLRLRLVSEALVTHAPEPARLLRSHWLAAARCRGRSLAYLFHHWEHTHFNNPLLRLCYISLKLHLRRILQPPPALHEEGCPPWEMSYVCDVAQCRAALQERKRTRNYRKRGLVKINSRTTTTLVEVA